MTSKVSVYSRRRSTPASPESRRFVPSKEKGIVTIPTVRICLSFASRAIVGAAPVPVPPPIPAAMKTILAPSTASLNSARLSSAAPSPTSGRAPAPIPRVSFLPSSIFLCDLLRFKAFTSVLQIMVST